MLINNIEVKSCFIFTPLNIENIVNDFNRIEISDFNLYYSKDCNVKLYNFYNTKIILIGYLFDIRNGNASENDIINNLLNSKDIYDELDYINGRFNLIINNDKLFNIYTDASQLKPLVYHMKSRSLASHDEVLKMILEKVDYSFTKRPFSNHNEFDLTRYDEIYKFNPSLELDLRTFSFKRIYPRIPLQNISAEKTFDELKPYLDQSIKYLKRQDRKIFTTITGGIDSRVSAALTKSFKNNVEYLTYTKPQESINSKTGKRIYQIDEKIAWELKDNLGWDHSIINLTDYKVENEDIKYSNKFFNSRHSFSLASYYKYVKNYRNVIHIKSTVFGMGKADYPKILDEYEENIDFYKKCVHGLSSKFHEHYDVKKEINEYFSRNQVDNSITFGRHYFDLFHLESRMGNWHSMLTLETDPETDEFIFTNCRKIIDLIQQPDSEEKRNFTLYKLIINYYWPILLYFGVNKVENKNLLEDKNDTKENENILMEEYIYDIKVREQSNIIVSKEENSIIVKPSKSEVEAHDLYSFIIENSTNGKQTVHMRSPYSNPEGAGRINVLVRCGNDYKVYDILELNEGISFELEQFNISVSIFYNNDYKRASWQAAGRLYIYK